MPDYYAAAICRFDAFDAFDIFAPFSLMPPCRCLSRRFDAYAIIFAIFAALMRHATMLPLMPAASFFFR